MKKLSLLVLLLAAFSAYAQMTPTAGQFKRLMKERQRLIHLQTWNSKLQAELAFEVGQFQQICREVVAQNNWPAGTTCELTTLSFYQPKPESVIQPAKTEPKAPEK